MNCQESPLLQDGEYVNVSFAYSVAVTFELEGDSFYMELATLVDVMLLGHWMEMASVQGASRALEHLADLVPAIAHKQVNGQIEDVAVSSLTEGDRSLIRPGEQVPIAIMRGFYPKIKQP